MHRVRPIHVMETCHRRLERGLDAVRRIAWQGGPLESAMRGELARVLRYFRRAAPRHTADEELSLFPRMRAMAAMHADGGDIALSVALTRLGALHAEHQAVEGLHERLDRLGRRWLHAGYLSEGEQGELIQVVDELEALYGRHIAMEEDEVFPAAVEALDAAELEAIAREMQARRLDVRSPARRTNH